MKDSIDLNDEVQVTLTYVGADMLNKYYEGDLTFKSGELYKEQLWILWKQFSSWLSIPGSPIVPFTDLRKSDKNKTR